MNERLRLLLDRYSHWLQLRGRSQKLMDSNREVHVTRFFMAWFDEWISPGSYQRTGGHPWWAPFNVFLHRWSGSDGGRPHNHPRWNMTVVLTGRLTEVCGRRVYFHGPGSIVLRSPYSFHKLFVADEWKDKTYTLFFVGRRNYSQQLLMEDGTTKNWFPFDQWIDGHPWDKPAAEPKPKTSDSESGAAPVLPGEEAT